jgi:release factor glutamine methyltransferase
LKATSQSPALDADLICTIVTGYPRTKLIAYPDTSLSEDQWARLMELLALRMKHVPIAHLAGTREFWGMVFHVSDKVLIPRPETEHLVEEAVRFLRERQGPGRILDLGTGTACISIAIATELREAPIPPRVLAIDRSEDALEVATLNVRRHQLQEIIHLIAGNWFQPLTSTYRFDLIVSNPPYIAADDPRRSPELEHEPSSALFAEEEGLADIKRIIEAAPAYLVPDRYLLIEIGSGQGAEVVKIAGRQGFKTQIIEDFGGHERVAALRLNA